MKNVIATLLLCILTANLFAQDNTIEMADAMFSNGKIYVVVASVAVILLGLFLYLMSIDRRIKKVEKNTNS